MRCACITSSAIKGQTWRTVAIYGRPGLQHAPGINGTGSQAFAQEQTAAACLTSSLMMTWTWLVCNVLNLIQSSCSRRMRCCRLLEADERNFHGWGYRQFLMELMQAAPEDEEAYAAAKIDKNFSNYSAWHLKTRLLKKVHHQSPTVTLDDLLKSQSSGSVHQMSKPAALP